MTGELISICVSILWTGSALFFEYAGRKLKSANLNLIRLIFAFLLLGGILWIMSGSPLPQMTDGRTWFWMSLSGFVGFVFGDFFLFSSYRVMPARFTQLIMTLAPLFAALAGYLLLGERLTGKAAIGMVVTLFGIALSILHKGPAQTPAAPAITSSATAASATSPAAAPATISSITAAPAIGFASFRFRKRKAFTSADAQRFSNCESSTPLPTAVEPVAESPTALPTAVALVAESSTPLPTAVAPAAESSTALPTNAAPAAPSHRHAPDIHLTIPAKGLIFAFLASIGQGVGLVLSKQGMIFYEQSALLQGTPSSSLYIPLAATQIRIITGIVCFAVIIAFMHGFRDFFDSLREKKSIAAAFGGSIVGPVVGVSLSLLAVQHANTAIASTLMALTPIIILIPDRFLYRRHVTFIEVIGAIISVCGVAILVR